MNNFQCVVAVLTRHRLARRWTDEAVAHEVCAELALDETDTATNATPDFDATAPTEAEVLNAEAEAKAAADKAADVRSRFDDRYPGAKSDDAGDRRALDATMLRAQAGTDASGEPDADRVALDRTLERVAAHQAFHPAPDPLPVSVESNGDRLRREADEADRADDPNRAAQLKADASEADREARGL